MLVFARKPNEAFSIYNAVPGDADAVIRVVVTHIGKRQVRIGIDAPASVRVVRDDAINNQPPTRDTEEE